MKDLNKKFHIVKIGSWFPYWWITRSIAFPLPFKDPILVVKKRPWADLTDEHKYRILFKAYYIYRNYRRCSLWALKYYTSKKFRYEVDLFSNIAEIKAYIHKYHPSTTRIMSIIRVSSKRLSTTYERNDTDIMKTYYRSIDLQESAKWIGQPQQ